MSFDVSIAGATRAARAPVEAPPLSLVDALLESDAAYFDWGATCEPLEGAVLSYMPGLAGTAAGCVVHRIAPNAIGNPDTWIRHMEGAFARAGGARPRLYTQTSVPQLERALTAHGYRPREEIGMICLTPERGTSAVRLLRVSTDAGWDAKRALHGASGRGPDGHDTAAAAWVDLERRKCEQGDMAVYLVASPEGEICATVAFAVVGGLLRMKNLVVSSAWRGRGVGSATVRAAHDMAAELGLPIGCFALAGEQAASIYAKSGMEIVASQMEWVGPALPAVH